MDAAAATDDAMEDWRESYRNERYRRLGFHPQKEVYANHYLPYAEHLDDESQLMLADIKNNLARSVALRELKPSVGFFVNKLMTYIKLYGLKFSKEDHIKFIKLLLALIEIPNLEPLRLNRFCCVLSQLLRKSSWISPDDLEIDWRPLYKICQYFMNKSSAKGDFYRYFARGGKKLKTTSGGLIARTDDRFGGGGGTSWSHLIMILQKEYGFVDDSLFGGDADEMSLESNVQTIVQQCSTYFSKNSTQEILDEVFPKLYPLDTGKTCETFALLSLFLNQNHGYELWFKDCMNLWDTYHNPMWNIDLMNKIAGIASENIGLIDWEPYIPTIFTRILRALELPVYYKNMKSSRGQSLWATSVAIWITSVLSPTGSCQSHLRQFLGTIESYLHPANTGKWQNAIADIIVQIPKYFENRLIRERYRTHAWKRPIPDEFKLTEKCITEFVEGFRPIAFQAIYSRVGALNVSRIFKLLAELRPELIIPGVIERVYSTLDSLTEPHKMTASLHCLVSVSRPLVAGHNGYTAGRTHVIPILFASLPGIDPNDFRKTSITFDFLTSFALLVPLIDCSKAGVHWSDLSDEEMLICDQTADLEVFVLQYLERVFALIESSSQVSIRMEQSDIENLRSKLEAVIEASLQSSTHGILGQCSREIIAAATRKLVDFVQSHLFEPRVAAHLVASLVRVFARIAGPDMRKLFVPYLIATIHRYIAEHDDIAEVEKQSDEMLYYVILLCSVVRGDPREVVHFVDDVLPIVDQMSRFKCKLTNRYTNALLVNILSNVSSVQTTDVRSSPESFDRPLSEYLPIRHWGEKSQVDIQWYVPGDEAVAVCRLIVHRYLPPILQQFDRYVQGGEKLTRDEILRDTSTVLALMKCGNFLPNWAEPSLETVSSSSMSQDRLALRIGFEDKIVEMPDGQNVRLAIVRSIGRLQTKVLQDYEDDIKSLKAIILIWERVHQRRQYSATYDMQMKSYRNLKTFQEQNLTPRKREIRAIWATRVLMQQDVRDEMSPPDFTASHLVIVQKLLELSTSHYSVVRIVAQQRLFALLNLYRNSYKFILDEILRCLALDANEHHEQFKGILYIIGGTRKGRLVVRSNWQTIEKIWLAILRTNLSEKPSVVRLMDNIMDAIENEFPTVTVNIEIPDKCVQLALDLCGDSMTPPISSEEIETGRMKLCTLNALNLQTYENILSSIIQITHNNSLHWRYGLMASAMIRNLIHPNVNYPPIVVAYCCSNLINELIEERKLAIRTLRFILQQQKYKHVKTYIDPFSIANVPRPTEDANHKLAPGIRSDNRWLQYDLATLPRSQAEWDRPAYVHKCEGFFGWSTGFRVAAPFAQQPVVRTDPAEMNEVERVLWTFFMDPSNFGRLIEFWSMEEKRGAEKFSASRCFIVKDLCAHFGEPMVAQFLPHIKRLVEATRNLESSHRCAAEMMGGLLKGIKYWTYEQTDRLYAQISPIIRTALSNITVETDVFWGTCFSMASENFDPKRQYWLHELLMENPLRESSSFIDCSRIYCLQGPFNQHVWRMTSVAHRLLDYLRPFLSHSFQNVRDRLGSLLINIFEADLHFVDAAEPECPRIRDFIAEVVGKIQILNDEEYPAIEGGSSISENSMDVDGAVAVLNNNTKMEVDTVNSDGYFEAVRLFKTTCQWLIGVLNRSTNGNIPEYFELLSFACRLERCEQDAELANTCSSLLALLSQALTLSDCMPIALNRIDAVANLPSWSARLSVIDVLQVLVFNNMFIVRNNGAWVQKVRSIVLRLLEDSVLEVREKAAQVLGGLLHCSFLPDTDTLLDLFKRKCRTKVSKKASLLETEAVRARHMGVLGLCAFISAYPYDIPDFVPDIFEHLGAHLNDPPPISSTIRKTVGDFKRTHHDNWATHQLKFTENQLAVLSDLTIPPSYYA